MLRRVLSFKQLTNFIQVSRAQINRWERTGQFPRRIQVSATRVGWYEDEVTDFIESRRQGQMMPALSTGYETRA